MNSQVLVDLLREWQNTFNGPLLKGGPISALRNKTAFALALVDRELLATPAPIPDAGEVERLVTEQVKHAYYERKTITEAVGEIVSALQADHVEDARAMVVPMQAELSFLEDWLKYAAEPIGQSCCGRSYGECCGNPEPDYVDMSVLLTDMDNRRKAIIRQLAASPAPGDSQ